MIPRKLTATRLQGIEEPSPPLWERLLLCFSLRNTLPRLLSLQRARNSIGIFDGLRALSMLWVVVGHHWLWIFKQWPSNMSAVIALGDRLSFQAVAATPFAVDTFFFISGFLVCYSCLNMLNRRKSFPWLKFYLHRYLRITPAYAFVMMIFVQVRGKAVELTYWTKALLAPVAPSTPCPWLDFMPHHHLTWLVCPSRSLPFWALVRSFTGSSPACQWSPARA